MWVGACFGGVFVGTGACVAVGRPGADSIAPHSLFPQTKQQNVKATMVDRVGSWRNYAALFTALIEDDDGACIACVSW